ncbi:MAG: B12-binding domain-containing radical SAM protein [Flavobacteriales bacterium]|nr:B12-binding domain-containing radical SAM protein [Flavobacteriales bacterium]
MKILLTHGYFLCDDPKEQKIMRPYPPLGLLYISAYLKERDVEHEVYDTTFATTEEFYKKIEEFQPEIIGFYVNLMTKTQVIKIAQVLENLSNAPFMIFGGPDIRYNWENYLKHAADAVIFGEGEETFYELVQAIGQGRSKFENIPGLAYITNKGELIKNDERQRIKDINEIPFPNRNAIDMNPYLETWKQYHGARTLSISTQRGCPYTCKWCSTAVYGQSYRRRKPKLVVDEIEILIDQYQAEALWFVDDVFTVSHKWIDGFHEEMRTRNLAIQYECITRAERLNESVIQKLSETGCFRIWIGAESGSQRIVDKMDRRVDLNTVVEMMSLAKKYNIEVGTFIMIGYPTETIEDINLTIDYLKRANPDLFTITKTYPIKGTALYEELEPELEQLDWSTSTDRQISFKRTYPERFYDFAIRKIVNEVNHHQALLRRDSIFKRSKFLAKAKIATFGMSRYS